MATHDPIAELLMNRTFSMEDTGMANFDALDRDLMRVKGTRDRITDLFAKRTPPLEDIGRSLLRAVGGKSTYGEELNALRAGRIKDFQSLYDVLSKERGSKLAERKQASAEKQHVWEKLKYAREQGNQDATAILKAIEFYSGDDLKDRRVLAEELEKLPADVTALNAWTVVSQTANRLSLTGRFKGQGGGKLTTAQKRENAEVDQARKSLDQEGLSHEDVMRIAKSQRDTGRNNPEYSPFINSRVRQATRRKYGDDPEYAVTYGRYLTPSPEFSQPAGMRPLPAGVSAEEPGILDRGLRFFGFGDDASAPSGAGAAEPGAAPTGIASPVRPLPLTADGRVHEGRLVVGQVYETKDLTLWRWNGQGFTEVAE